jgi:hypothetical protein
MLEGLDNVDWEKLQAAQIRHWLKAAASKKHQEARLTALRALQDYLVHWELMEGYASTEQWHHLHNLMSNDIPSVVIPFLIIILEKATTYHDKLHLLEILYDLCRYERMADKHSMEFGTKLRFWGTRLQELVRTGIHVYRTLLFDEERDVRIMSNELLWILGDEYFIAAWSNRQR